jgi:flagellar hook-length control protein FliK
VPQVASDPKVHPSSHSLVRTVRPPQQTDRAPSPFETLLDDSSQAAEPSPPPHAETKIAASDNSQAPARPNDSRPQPTNDDTQAASTDFADVGGQSGDNGKPICDAQAQTDLAANADTTVIVRPNNPKDDSASGPNTDNGPTVSPDNSQTVNVTNAVALIPAATLDQAAKLDPATGQQGNQIAELPAAAANAIAANVTVPAVRSGAKKQTEPAKETGIAAQVDTDLSSSEATDNAQSTTPAVAGPNVDKPQSGGGDHDRQRVAERNEIHARTQAEGNQDSPAPTDDSNVAIPKTVPEPTQPAVTAVSSSTAAGVSTPSGPAQMPPPVTAVPIAGLAVEIAGKAFAGKNRFEIRLDPPELGRIEVRLDVDRDGNVTSRLTVDRADTYDLLRRDAAGLERALQDAGLKTADNGLQFSLRDQTMNQQQQNNGSDTAQILVKDEDPVPTDVIPQSYTRRAGQGGGLDIRV